MSTLFIFPGQGSQYAGMGKDLYEKYETAKSIYDRASEVLGFDIVDLSFNDPKDELNFTRFTQPALLTHHIACLEVFRELNGGKIEPSMTAGHSLGEYSALVAAGFLEHVAGNPTRGRVRDRVVHMKEVQLFFLRDLVHRDGECERIRRILEERVTVYFDFVKEHPLVKMREPERLRV